MPDLPIRFTESLWGQVPKLLVGQDQGSSFAQRSFVGPMRVWLPSLPTGPLCFPGGREASAVHLWPQN